MSEAIMIGLGVFAVLFVLRSLLGSSIDRAMQTSIQTNTVEPVAAFIESKPADNQATLLNHSVKRLWETYHRDLAARLVRRVGPNISDASITHYWIQKCLEVEPEMASEHLDADFLIEHYRPDLAAKCGSAG